MFSFSTFLVLFLSFVSLALVFYILGVERPFQFGLKNVFNTVVFWTIINMSSIFGGVGLPLSLVSLGVSIFCGIPGAIMMFLLKAVF